MSRLVQSRDKLGALCVDVLFDFFNMAASRPLLKEQLDKALFQGSNSQSTGSRRSSVREVKYEACV